MVDGQGQTIPNELISGIGELLRLIFNNIKSMDSDTYLTISAIGTLLAAIGAFVAAIGSWRSARATRKAAEAQLYARFMAEYSAPEMLKALRVLRHLKEKYGENFDKCWIDCHKKGNRSAWEVDKSRRHVKFYFVKALHLYELGYVSEKFLKKIGDVDGINLLFEIVEPLEKVLNPAYREMESPIHQLRKVCPRRAIGEQIVSIPPCPSSDNGASDK